MQSLLQLIGLDWAVPDFSTLCRHQGTLNVSLLYRGGTNPLNLLIDSTGIKAEGEGEWNARKYSPHTCKRVLPDNERFQATYLAQDTPSLPDGVMQSMIPRGELTEKRWKYVRSKSQAATTAMRPCCPIS